MIRAVGWNTKFILNVAMALGPYSARLSPWGEIVMRQWIHLHSTKSHLHSTKLVLHMFIGSFALELVDACEGSFW